MPRTAPFETHHQRYDEWFVRHAAAYHSELLAVRAQFPWAGFGLSIGVGTGRFAAPMGIQIGIDPAHEVLGYASKRGIATVQAVAEALPFAAHSFARALCVTTICFVDDAAAMLREAYRVLQPDGVLVIGFIDRTSGLGQHYLGWPLLRRNVLSGPQNCLRNGHVQEVFPGLVNNLALLYRVTGG